MDSSHDFPSSHFFLPSNFDLDPVDWNSSEPPAATFNTQNHQSDSLDPLGEDVHRDWADLLSHSDAPLNTSFFDTQPPPRDHHATPLTIDPRLLTMNNTQQQQQGASPAMNIPTFTAINGGQSSTGASGLQHSSAGPSIAAPAPSNAVVPAVPGGRPQRSPLDILAEAASISPTLPIDDDNGSDNTGENSGSSNDSQPNMASNPPPTTIPPPATAAAPAPVPAIPAPLPAAAAPAPLIPDVVFANSMGQPYDRRWMIVNNIGQNIFNGFNHDAASKLKLDYLGRHGVIVPGDVLRVITQDRRGRQTQRDGQVMSSSMDIQYSTRTGHGSRNLYRCAGPTPFLQAIIREFPGSRTVGTGWNAVRLIDTNGQDLGSLWLVRQWLQLWVEEYDKWAARTPGALLRRTTAGAGPRPNVQVRRH